MVSKATVRNSRHRATARNKAVTSSDRSSRVAVRHNRGKATARSNKAIISNVTSRATNRNKTRGSRNQISRRIALPETTRITGETITGPTVRRVEISHKVAIQNHLSSREEPKALRVP